jgi:hypothetical protein
LTGWGIGDEDGNRQPASLGQRDQADIVHGVVSVKSIEHLQ